MSRIRLYLDEDVMDGDLVRALRRHHVDTLTAFEAGMIQREDEDHFRFAARLRTGPGILLGCQVRNSHRSGG